MRGLLRNESLAGLGLPGFELVVVIVVGQFAAEVDGVFQFARMTSYDPLVVSESEFSPDCPMRRRWKIIGRAKASICSITMPF